MFYIRKTAKTFLAASVFLELLKVFGELDGETAQKVKYAKFRATDIIKAIKEGRSPSAPATPATPSPAHPSPSQASPSQTPLAALPSQAPLAQATIPLASAPQEDDQVAEVDEETLLALQKAQKHAKFAQSALLYEDITTAVDNLEKALAILKPLHNK